MTVKLNPDQEVVDAIRNRLKVTDGQCPCVAQYLWTEDTRCPCKPFREQQYCCCHLYINEEEEKEQEVEYEEDIPDATEWLTQTILKIIEAAEKVGLTQEDLQNAVDNILKLKEIQEET